MTVLNANDKLVQYNDEVNRYLNTKCEEFGIKIENNVVLTEIMKLKKKLILKNKKDSEQKEYEYDNFYSVLPLKSSSILLESGLSHGKSRN